LCASYAEHAPACASGSRAGNVVLERAEWEARGGGYRGVELGGQCGGET